MSIPKVEISVTNIYKSYAFELFSGLSFDLKTGSSVALSGCNGSGKTTLLMIISGLVSYNSGTVEYYIDDVKKTVEEIRSFIGITSPMINYYNDLTVQENLRFVACGLKQNYYEMKDTLHCYKLPLNEIYGNLSSGQKQRFKLAISLSSKNTILLLDEPFSFLDLNGSTELELHLKKIILQQNKVVVISGNSQKEKKLCSGEIVIGA